MIYKINETDKVKELFKDWPETIIYSCLQKVMGDVFVSDPNHPKAAAAVAGCFSFCAGEPDRELILNRPEGFLIIVPQTESWAKLIEDCIPHAKRVTRYAIKKDTQFDVEKLERKVKMLPTGYTLERIDAKIYDQCLKNADTCDFVSAFENKEQYLKLGRGFVVRKDGMIVAGASSYTRYLEGIEIEVDTVISERRKHLATAACSALILSCLKDGLYPSWDAQNLASVCLAESLGYKLNYAYTAYEIEG